MNTTIEKVKERPILFSTPMVKAILEGRKTVTRRLIEPQPIPCMHDFYIEADWKDQQTNWQYFKDNPDEWYCTYCGNGVDFHGNGMKCRYGAFGDILWVRETWAELFDTEDHPELPGNPQEKWSIGYVYKAGWKEGELIPKITWKPSIHMPRAACRLRLQIKSIRVERLHDITEEDAKREGAPMYVPGHGLLTQDELNSDPGYANFLNYRMGFEYLWSEINGKDSWNSNPWVWRIQFEKLEKR